MRVLLIMPPMTVHRQSIKRCLIPMGLASIAAVLEQADGCEVSILDAMVSDYAQEAYEGEYMTYGLSDKQISERINQSHPDAVGISCIMSSQLPNVLRVARLSKQAFPKVPVVVGGLHPSFFPQDALKSQDVDFVVLGEGEYRFKNLLDCLHRKTTPSMDGIAFRNDDGSMVVRQPQEKIKELDALPFPARHLLPMEDYIKVNISLSPYPKKKRVAEVLTSRGCPNRCIFCASSNFWGHEFRPRSAENVLNEIRSLKSTYAIEEIEFSDDNLTFDRERMQKLCEGLIPLKLKWCTPNGVSIDTLDEELLKLMKRSGCYQLTFSLESASERVLKKIMHKHVNLERVPGLVQRAHRLGISTHGTFVMGFPEESLDEISANFKLAYSLMFDSVSFFVVAPLPGSELYAQCREKGLLKDFDIKSIDYKKSMLNLNYISADKLQGMIDERMQNYNRCLLVRHPVRFFRKYGKFMAANPASIPKIFGRVT